MPPRARPLSPHLQIYRWQISNSLSILNRVTGVILSIGLLAFAAWFVALADGESAYRTCMDFLRAPLGLVMVASVLFAFFYHLLNGVRHLVWDTGRGFERRTSRASGWAVVVGTLLCTAAVLVLAR